MTNEAISIAHRKTEFDDWRAVSISLYLAIVGYGVLVGIPVISTAWVTQLGFSETQVGRVAGADLGGLSVGAVVASLLIQRLNRRWLVVGAIATTVVANALCMIFVDYGAVLLLRLVAGFGSGIYTAIAVASLGATAHPARAYNIMLFIFAFSQAFELQVLPQLSMNGIYFVFVAFNLAALPFLAWLPPRASVSGLGVEVEEVDDTGQRSSTNVAVPAYVPWLCLAAIAATYVNIGAYWTYIELASLASPAADADWVGRALVWASFLSIVGCLVATLISNRYGLARPLLVTLVTHAVIVGMLAFGINNTNVVVSLFMFNFLWIFIDVYQSATVANVDKSGRYAALMPAAVGFGQILGPNIAASILGFGLGYGSVFLMSAFASLVAMSIYGYMYLRLRQIIPALADAS
ncbi:MAG: MFS transporter [Pseudomonadota bacterium]